MQLTSNNSSWQEKAITLIKNAEGFKSTVYTDTTGNQTIGYGFNLSNPFFANIKTVLTEKDADAILRSFVVKEVFPHISSFANADPINNNQRAVVADMIYNLGFAGFQTFNSFSGFLYNDNGQAAAADLINTEWFQQVGLRGIRNALNLIVNDNYLYLE